MVAIQLASDGRTPLRHAEMLATPLPAVAALLVGFRHGPESTHLAPIG
jgi:hypothetical protein